MFCPHCKIKLNSTILYNVEVDYCPRCLGLWFEEEELRWAKDFKDRANIGKLDAFKNPVTAEKYQITGIPTIIIFKNGEIKEKVIGLTSKQIIVNKLNSLL